MRPWILGAVGVMLAAGLCSGCDSDAEDTSVLAEPPGETTEDVVIGEDVSVSNEDAEALESDITKPTDGDDVSEPDVEEDAGAEQDVDEEEQTDGEGSEGEDTLSDVIDPEESLPAFAKKGPYNAGLRIYTITYDLPGLEEPRTIEIGVWYPTEDTEGESIAWGGLLQEEDLFVNASVLELPEGEQFPVRAYTHGNMGLMGDSSNTSEFFASHGWVTVAPNHTGNTLLDFIEPRPSWMFYARPRDMKEALDHMESLESSDPFSGALNLEEIVLMGHSYGGYTGYGLVGAEFDYSGIESACTGGEGPISGPCTPEQLAEFGKSVQDPRFVAYAPLDGGNPDVYGESGVQKVEVPMLQMYAIEPEAGAHSGSEVYWNWLKDTKSIVRVGIEGGCHIGFTLGFCNGISDEEGYKIIHAYLMAFSQHHVLGQSSPELTELMSGELTVSEQTLFEITEEAKTYWDGL